MVMAVMPGYRALITSDGVVGPGVPRFSGSLANREKSGVTMSDGKAPGLGSSSSIFVFNEIKKLANDSPP